MKDEILKNIGSVINALSCVEVHGKANLMNLGGSIDVLEQVMEAVSHMEVCEGGTEEV